MIADATAARHLGLAVRELAKLADVDPAVLWDRLADLDRAAHGEA